MITLEASFGKLGCTHAVDRDADYVELNVENQLDTNQMGSEHCNLGISNLTASVEIIWRESQRYISYTCI
jgi:hypothetical protein